MNDIDLSSYSNWDPIGEYDTDTGTGQVFTGLLDGNGYLIKNLTFQAGGSLFAVVGDVNNSSLTGEIKNLGLDNIDISGGTGAGLAILYSGNISNCFVTGVIDSDSDGSSGLATMFIGNIDNTYTSVDIEANGHSLIGGLFGSCMGEITNSYTTGNITNGGQLVGGLVGQSYCDIANCYTVGNILGKENIGGLVGQQNGGHISNCYTISNVQGDDYFGAITGAAGNSAITNNIWNTETTGQSVAIGDNQGGTESNNKGLTTSEMQDPSNWSGWDTSIWDFSTYPPMFKMYTPTGGGSTGGGDVQIPGAVRLQIGSDSSSTSAIYVDTSFDLGAFDVDFSSADSCAAAIEDIDEVLSRINTKRSEFGAVINRLSSVLESQTTTIQNFTSAKSTIMDADIANESADFVKNQILQQTSSALLAQSQNLHASIVLSLIG